MSNETLHRSPQSVSQELGISPASLRRWSDEFTDYLSDKAGANTKSGAHRRYTEADVKVLTEIKDFMNNGLTYEQVRQHLNGQSVVSVEPDDISPGDIDGLENLVSDADEVEQDYYEPTPREDNEEDQPDEHRSIVAASENSESPAIAFLTNTLTTLSDGQKSILNSQAANRELLGVLLQDNFNLKEENNRLRERVLEIEREMAKSREEEQWRREALRQELEAKILAANQLASEAVTTANSIKAPEIKAVETQPGCLGMFLGRGGTQIITAFPRKKAKPDPASQEAAQSPASSSQPTHPKPFFPPE